MDLSDTLYVFIKFTGNFLKKFEKIFNLKQEDLSEYSKLTLSFKISIFSHFLTYNLLGVSYGDDVFSNAKI